MKNNITQAILSMLLIFSFTLFIIATLAFYYKAIFIFLMSTVACLAMKHAVDFCPLFVTISSDIKAGRLKVKSMDRGRVDVGDSLVIRTNSYELIDMDPFSAICIVGKYREHILPIGPFGSYLLFRLARKSYINSRQKEVDYLKLIRGEVK